MAKETHWFLLETSAGEAAFNMALDEALLEAAARLDAPVLRFYSWNDAAATFGYFQKYTDVAALTTLRPLIRRATGGGLVPHAADWTYSLVFPPTHPWHALSAWDSYQRVHAWICAAFTALGIVTELATTRRIAGPGQCFVGWERFDVLWQGRKVAGAAQRRNQLGLLIQGSLQPPPVPLARKEWQAALCHHARTQWNVIWQPLECDLPLRERTAMLVAEKYAQSAYHERR